MSSNERLSSPIAESSNSFWLDGIVYYDSSGSEADAERECIVSDYDYGTDSSGSESDEEESESHPSYLYGRNKHQWLKVAPSQIGREKVDHQISTNLMDNAGDNVTVWKKLFDEDILQDILRWTNVKLNTERSSVTGGKDDLYDLDMPELLSFIGMLIYSAFLNTNGESADHLFETDGFVSPIYRCVMSKDRFVNLLKCVRFNESIDKDERRKNKEMNNLSIKNIFQTFVKNCQNLFNPGEKVTVDKFLIPFKEPPCLTYHRRRCNKQSLQIMSLCDAVTGYFFNGFIYKGDDDEEGITEDEKMYSVSTKTVLRLTRPLHGTNRNVTCDKNFTSIELIDSLKRNGFSCVGAVKKGLDELPPSFTTSKARAKGSTLYAFTEQVTLVSYAYRKRKIYIAISSMHRDEEKSEIIPCYNATMGGVAKIVEKRSMYSCARHTRRASLAVFFWMLDISLINAHIALVVHRGKKIKREDFMMELARSLVLEQLLRRVYDLRLPLGLRRTISKMLGADMPDAPEAC